MRVECAMQRSQQYSSIYRANNEHSHQTKCEGYRASGMGAVSSNARLRLDRMTELGRQQPCSYAMPINMYRHQAIAHWSPAAMHTDVGLAASTKFGGHIV